MEQGNLGTCSTGIQPNIAAFLSYVLGFISGLIFYLIEKDNKFVRFHAMQSILVFGLLAVLHFTNMFVLFFVPWVLRSAISMIISLATLVLWILLMIKAYRGEYFKLPIAGDIAEQNS
jgi:uncharacterized membrane protein